MLLATGKTAHDFRQNFRHGAHGANLIECNSIAGREALLAGKLDGFVVMRLSKEQTKNVKLRWAKMRDQDRLLHDPQGQAWMGMIRCWLNAVDEAGVIERLMAMREEGEQLTALPDEVGSQKALERASKELLRYVRSTDFKEKLDWDEDRRNKEARSSFYGAKHRMHQGVGSGVVDEWRKEIEEGLVVAEAFVDGQDVQAAWADPDTSKRHSTLAQLQARFDRVENAVGERWKAERKVIREAKEAKYRNADVQP